MLSVLLLEDDPLISQSLQMSLNYQGFSVQVANTISAANQYIETDKVDIFILDVNLPDGNGFEFCERIRKRNESVPVIMLTAKTDESSAVKGISLGADDYIRKPFGVDELVVRMNRLLDRRSKLTRLIQFGEVKIDLNKHVAWVGLNEMKLGRREFEILRLLVQRQGDVITREEILNALNEKTEIYDRTIDSHLSHLRKKLRESGAMNLHISPVYGVGYRLEEK